MLLNQPNETQMEVCIGLLNALECESDYLTDKELLEFCKLVRQWIDGVENVIKPV